MTDPEWVRRNFGEDAVVAMTSPPRKSSEDGMLPSSKHNSKNASTYNSQRNSGRKSDESDRETPRDRTSSSASKRGKLRRLFSRPGMATMMSRIRLINLIFWLLVSTVRMIIVS